MRNEEIKQWLREVLNRIPVSIIGISIETAEPETTVFSIETAESGLLIGNNGETLQALNHLLRRVAEKKWGVSPDTLRSVVLDVNGYRKKNEERLKGIATMLGERAVGFKHEVEMEPMGAYERRIVHSFFQSHPNLTTESRGEGRRRHIVIKYVEEKTYNLQPTTNN